MAWLSVLSMLHKAARLLSTLAQHAAAGARHVAWKYLLACSMSFIVTVIHLCEIAVFPLNPMLLLQRGI